MNLDEHVVDSDFEAQAMMKHIDKQLTVALNDIATALQRNIKRNVNKPGTGIKHPGLPKVSSAPFMPPANQSGTLMRSWQTRVRKDRGPNKTLILGSNLNYARFLERGTRNKSGTVLMYPRPYIAEAVRKTQKQVPRIAKKLRRKMRMTAMELAQATLRLQRLGQYRIMAKASSR